MSILAVFVLFMALAVKGAAFPTCQISYKFAKVCSFYNYHQKTCEPWNLSTCRKIKTTLHEHKCPVYKCVSELKTDNLHKRVLFRVNFINIYSSSS